MQYRLLLLSSILAVAEASAGLGKRLQDLPRRKGFQVPPTLNEIRQDRETLVPRTDKTEKYYVNGTAIPDVDFDVGESYAGLMPIGGENSTDELFFWYFPTADEVGKDTVTIWLNGGPYCSSLAGLLQENGPFLWLPGTTKPIRNSWSWANITNMIWVEQPVGTGFTQGKPVAENEEQVAADFVNFFKNFIETFDLQGKDIYITGESYAGYYIPYIADAMYAKNDKEYFDLKGTLLYDVIIGGDELQQEVITPAFVKKWPTIFSLNSTTTAWLEDINEKCGFTEYIEDNLKYPPKPYAPAPLSNPKPGCTVSKTEDGSSEDIWYDVVLATSEFNPCFDVYHIVATCPQVYDVDSSVDTSGSFQTAYFNRTDVQKAINAPIQNWEQCSDQYLPLDNDQSAPSAWEVYPRVIEKSERSVLVVGSLDFILPNIGLELVVQNMTWNGKQGFQTKPSDKFFVPIGNGDPSLQNALPLSGFGEVGITHTERGLTWVEGFGAGHMGPRDMPAAAFRQLQYLLGRVDTLTE